MKYTRFLPLVLTLVGAFAACAIHVPWELMDDYDGVRVVMRVVPEDADVLLNGRFIGAAYEYSSARLALILASRENDLEFRKQGFRRKVVNLREYSTRRITLNVRLEGDEALAQGNARVSPPPSGGATAPEKDRAYEAQNEPLPPLPAEKPVPRDTRFLTLVALTVSPEEAAVYIDNRFWGLSSIDRKTIFLRLPPGKYALTAFKPGYAAFSREIIVPKQEKWDLAIDLQK